QRRTYSSRREPCRQISALPTRSFPPLLREPRRTQLVYQCTTTSHAAAAVARGPSSKKKRGKRCTAGSQATRLSNQKVKRVNAGKKPLIACLAAPVAEKIGRASCRERVYIAVAVTS